MTAASGPGYDEWNDLLCQHFFAKGRSGEPTTFFVDDEILASLGDSSTQEAVGSLTEAVKKRLRPEWTGDCFSQVYSEAVDWLQKKTVDCPPFLPLLAVSVLAAAHMARSVGIAPNDYYKRFRELLDLPGQREPRGYGDVLPVLWKWYTRWLDDLCEGRRGKSTVVGHPHYTNIGYALSQALFRESDRQRLTHFFQWINLKPGERIETSELMAYFKAWASGRAGLSPGLSFMLHSEVYQAQLQEIVVSTTDAWDGVLRDEAGRREGRILFTLELFPRLVLGLIAERPPGFPDRADFRTSNGTVQTLTAEGEWYDGLSIRLSKDVLVNGLSLKGDGYALSLKGSRVIPLRQDPRLGCWASTRQLFPGEAHWVLADAAALAEVTAFLRDQAREGWSIFESPSLPEGTILIRDVVIDDASPERATPSIRRLIPTPQQRPTLWGGLGLSTPATYLTDGEPDLWVPPSETAETSVVVDGIELPAPAVGQRLALRGHHLAAGTHEILLRGARLHFRTIRTVGVVEPAGSGTCSHHMVLRDGRYEALSLGAVCSQNERATCVVSGPMIQLSEGTLLDDSRPPIVLPLGRRAYALLGARPGEISRPSPPTVPSWMRSIGLIPWGFEFFPAFNPVWAVISTRTGAMEARLVTVVNPGEALADESALHDWITVIGSVTVVRPQAESLLAEYRAAATGLGAEL